MVAMVAVPCPFCKYRLKFPADAQGEAVACTSCNKRFRIKAAEEPADAGPTDGLAPVRVVSRRSDAPAGVLLRNVAWGACVGLCAISWLNFWSYTSTGSFDFETARSVYPSAIQQAGAAGSALVGMFMAFVVARAVDAFTRR